MMIPDALYESADAARGVIRSIAPMVTDRFLQKARPKKPNFAASATG
jgi:hypothetical protein